MIPYWNETLTVFSKRIAENGEVSWISKMYAGCFWRRKALRERSAGAEFALNGFVCRIPGITEGVNIGDIVVRGEVHDTIDEYAEDQRSIDLLKRYAGKCMTVSNVHENSGPVSSMNHLYAEGS